ncbi:MAG TPA: fibronectin type III domain-containing protein [Gemmatimonadales bacterium]|nr:fibronectin type III domain-containing protein [Gemmatimonadales bacterium]
MNVGDRGQSLAMAGDGTRPQPGKRVRGLLILGVAVLAISQPAAAQEAETPFLVAPAAEGVVLRWAWPEGERPLGYHVERRESGGAWIRLTAQPIARVRSRATAASQLGDVFPRVEPLLFPADPLDEIRDPESYRSLLLLLADLEPGVATALGLRYDDRPARSGASYEYRLITVTRRGEREAGTSAPVVAGSFRPAAPPDSLRAVQESDGVALRWSTVGGFTAYHLFRRVGAQGPWEQLSGAPVVVFMDDGGAGTESSARFYRDSTARVGDTLAYAVAGIDPFGRMSGRSAEVRVVIQDVIPPAPPAQVTSRVNGDTVTISWVPSPDPSVSGYRVWRGATRDGAFQPVGAPQAASATMLSDPGRPAGRLTWYYVTATDAAGNESAPSFMAVAEVPDLAPPTPPDSLRGTGAVGRLSLAWAAVPAADLRGYRVYRAFSRDGEFALLTETPTATPVFTDSVRVGADHPFYYRVTAVDSAYNESPPSGVMALRPPDLTPPSAPMITAVAPDEGSLVVSWAPNPEPDVTWYRVRHRVRGREAWMDRPDSVPATVRTDTIPGLPPGELLEVSLVAVDDAGNRSAPARPMVGRPVTRQPPAVVGIRRAAVDRGRGVVVVEWDPPGPDVARVVILRRYDRDSTWAEVAALPHSARRFEDALPRLGAERARGQSPVRVEYVLRALDRFGNAAESRPRRVTVQREDE